ncbi:hypothetical protein QQ045_031454 [Rhodiola kirilowii]
MIKALAMSNTTVLICFMLLIFASFNPSRGYTLKLIHMDSPDSPYHIANDTLELRHKRWTELSERRYQYHFQELGVVLEGGPGAESRLYDDPIGLLMLAEFYLGTPGSRQLAVIMDTGSSFLWVVGEESPYWLGNYRFLYSSTCSLVSCRRDECRDVPRNNFGCDYLDYCYFIINYIGLDVRGVVATDTITFAAAGGGGSVNYLDIKFGFGLNMSKPENLGSKFRGTGVMGLSNWPSSIAVQVFDSRFSYCIGDLNDPEYGNNRLTFGGELEMQGMWTPILNFSSKIYVSLKKIVVQGEELDIDPTLFEGSLSSGGTIIDTGSPYSYLTDKAYRVFRAKINNTIPLTYGGDEAGKGDLDTLCRTNLWSSEVPIVKFVFDMGAELILDSKNLFHPSGKEDEQCMTIRVSFLGGANDKKVSIIGLLTQQMQHVGIDYNEGKIYFWESSCI